MSLIVLSEYKRYATKKKGNEDGDFSRLNPSIYARVNKLSALPRQARAGVGSGLTRDVRTTP